MVCVVGVVVVGIGVVGVVVIARAGRGLVVGVVGAVGWAAVVGERWVVVGVVITAAVAVAAGVTAVTEG